MAGATLIILLVWATGAYLPLLGHFSQVASTSSSTTGLTDILGGKIPNATLASWLSDNPDIVGSYSKADYPPDYSTLANFTIGIINSDRASAGVPPVTLSNVPSGQQHADSMAYHQYFSHWDTQGYKPYMRYTLLGGVGSIQENLALNFCSSSSALPTQGVPVPCSIRAVENAINSSEWGMMNNDSLCCGNGHRQNILDLVHNRVSIGIAYNATTVYLVEDFENRYLTTAAISVDARVVNLSISHWPNVSFWPKNPSGEEINVFFDPAPTSIPVGALGFSSSCSQFNEQKEPPSCQYRGSYDAGTHISTVFPPCPLGRLCGSGNYTYAQAWLDRPDGLVVIFSIQALESAYGNGVYTFYLWPAARAPEAVTSISVFVTGR